MCGSLPFSQGRTAWLKVSKREIGNLRNQRKRRSKQSPRRQAKKEQQRVGNPRSDQARRNRSKRAAIVRLADVARGRYYGRRPKNASSTQPRRPSPVVPRGL